MHKRTFWQSSYLLTANCSNLKLLTSCSKAKLTSCSKVQLLRRYSTKMKLLPISTT
jgi:hypothetical protein